MKTMHASLIFAMATLCIVLANPADSRAATLDTIVIISIDALHPAALTQKTAPLTLARLNRPGALLRKGVSTSPPKTLIAHAAMMTGKTPENGGRTSNEWQPGEPLINDRTIFHYATEQGYRTGFFYSKPKLGFLVSDAVDTASLSPEYAIDEALRFIENSDKPFVFLHVSGLDQTGPVHGWLSPEYLEELSYIDQYLEPLYKMIEQRVSYLLIITSDHAGHGKSHGGSHPEEAQLPFGAVSDIVRFPKDKAIYKVTDLKPFLVQSIYTAATIKK